MLTKTDLKKLENLSVSEGDEDLIRVLNALGEPGRFKIFKILLKRYEVCVSEIAKIMGISTPAASQQLRILEQSGLICRERTGQTVCYRVKENNLLVRQIEKLVS